MVKPDKRYVVMMQWKDWPPVACSSPMREEHAKNLLVMYQTTQKNRSEPRTYLLGEIVIVPTP